MINKKIVYFSIILFLVNLVIYLNLANAFIYFRIGEGNLTNPSLEVSSLMVNEGIGPKIKYVALGDSLTAGVGADTFKEVYPYLLAQKMSEAGRSVTLENFSVPGAKTKDVIDAMLTPAVVAKPDVVTILIGVNDIHNYVGKKQFKKNYEYILDRLSKETTAKIYLINIPRIGSDTIILPPLNYYFDKETDDYNQVIQELATAYKVKYIDLNTPTKNLLKHDGAHYSVDSFHPSAIGYKLWAQIIYDRLNY